MKAIVAAAPGHARLIRELFFVPLPEELVPAFTTALEHIRATLEPNGSFPPIPC
jgi:hypothetical protein